MAKLADCPPFLAVEDCREILGRHPCDWRRPITDIKPSFPGIDFSLIVNNEDVLWKKDEREPKERIRRRGLRFIQARGCKSKILLFSEPLHGIHTRILQSSRYRLAL
jgi:hypothetical protein